VTESQFKEKTDSEPSLEFASDYQFGFASYTIVEFMRFQQSFLISRFFRPYLNPRKNTPFTAPAWMEMNFVSRAFRPRLTRAIVSTVL
jgi:hypothetical protein